MSRCLLACVFALNAVLAQGAAGVSITQYDESKVAAGMSAADVQDRLGRPAQIRKYPNQPGPTWTYDVQGAPFGITKFDVDFGADGRVAATSERIIGQVW